MARRTTSEERPGGIRDLLCRDHRRLEALFERATADPAAPDEALYEQFRHGLLRHIAMEEKTLIPAAREAHGEPPALARRIRLDHAAITALLAPPPSPPIVTALTTLLAHHDDLEEKEGGLYDECERRLGLDAARVLAKLRSPPEIRVSARAAGDPDVMRSVRRIVAHAGYDLDRLAAGKI